MSRKKVDPKYLSPTDIIDCENPSIIAYAEKTAGKSGNPVDRSVRLYYAVRDGIWYDPYYPFYLPEHYRASNVLKSGRGYCVCKASLLCALGRASGIPSRLGFADVRNHLATSQLIEFLGTDLFVYHGFVEFYLENRWVKATPAFNAQLCKRHRVPPLEFNGREDSIFQSYNIDDKRFMEYVKDHGIYADVPVSEIVAAWEEAYGKERVREWILRFEESGGKPISDFGKEKVWKG